MNREAGGSESVAFAKGVDFETSDLAFDSSFAE